MKRSMSSSLAETAWPKVQYLWKLHPLFQWVNDKSGLLYGRGEAPVVGIPELLKPTETIFIMTGSIPNRKSTPLVDEWFGLLYDGSTYVQNLSMSEVLRRTGFRNVNIPNIDAVTEEQLAVIADLREDAVLHAQEIMLQSAQEYRNRTNPLLDEELDKLSELEKRHKVYQMSLFESERKKSEQERMVADIFNRFTTWVNDSLEIDKNGQAYIRIVAVIKGVER